MNYFQSIKQEITKRQRKQFSRNDDWIFYDKQNYLSSYIIRKKIYKRPRLVKTGPKLYELKIFLESDFCILLTNNSIQIASSTEIIYTGVELDQDAYFNISLVHPMITPKEVLELRKFMKNKKEALYAVFFTPFTNADLPF